MLFVVVFGMLLWFRGLLQVVLGRFPCTCFIIKKEKEIK